MSEQNAEGAVPRDEDQPRLVGDGIHDDTPALQAAINRAERVPTKQAAEGVALRNAVIRVEHPEDRWVKCEFEDCTFEIASELADVEIFHACYFEGCGDQAKLEQLAGLATGSYFAMGERLQFIGSNVIHGPSCQPGSVS